MKEISLVHLGDGKNALRNFKAKWDAAGARLVSLGRSRESDEEILYIYFKDIFMKSDDIADSVAKVRRSPASFNVHSYQWMYSAVEAHLETMRLETQEAERFAACKPEAANPITNGLQTKGAGGKGKSNSEGKGKKPELDTAKEACRRKLKDGKCSFGDRCLY